VIVEEDAVELEVIAATVEHYAGAPFFIRGALGQTAYHGQGRGTGLRAENEEDAVGGAVHDLDVAVSGRDLGFADEYCRIEMNRVRLL
jgi:hypothetical protein